MFGNGLRTECEWDRGWKRARTKLCARQRRVKGGGTVSVRVAMGWGWSHNVVRTFMRCVMPQTPLTNEAAATIVTALGKNPSLVSLKLDGLCKVSPEK